MIDELYSGIPGIILGGYFAGLAARGLGDAVAVTLSRPVAPGSSVVLDRPESEQVLPANDEPAARAVPSRFPSTAPDPVQLERPARARPIGRVGFAHFSARSSGTGARRRNGDENSQSCCSPA